MLLEGSFLSRRCAAALSIHLHPSLKPHYSRCTGHSTRWWQHHHSAVAFQVCMICESLSGKNQHDWKRVSKPAATQTVGFWKMCVSTWNYIKATVDMMSLWSNSAVQLIFIIRMFGDYISSLKFYIWNFSSIIFTSGKMDSTWVCASVLMLISVSWLVRLPAGEVGLWNKQTNKQVNPLKVKLQVAMG